MLHILLERSQENNRYSSRRIFDMRCLLAFIDASLPPDHHDLIQTKEVADRGFYFIVDHVLSILIDASILDNIFTLEIRRIYYLDNDNS